MPKLNKIYTKAGDDGTTGLGNGQRVKKHSPRIEAFGAVDELNSQIGVVLASDLEDRLSEVLQTVQNELFHLGADLCVPEQDKQRIKGPRIEQRHVDALESVIDRLTAQLGPLENFILPGGSTGAAQLHLARALCRRAERATPALAEQEAVASLVVTYLNRLSDALFVMAREENRDRGVSDVYWDSRS